jgi:GMP synthase-like glutamine amidotransferase
MRIHQLEHDPEDFSRTNITLWAGERGYSIKQTYVCNNEALPPVDAYDWLMVMGGSPHAWDIKKHSWLIEEKRYLCTVLELNKPVLGICFGAQLLAEALGGNIFPITHQEIGWREVTLTSEGKFSFLFQDLPQTLVTFHWHNDHFSLPPDCTNLAYSEASRNQAFISNRHPLVGLQFHPEYTREMVLEYTRTQGELFRPGRFADDKESIAIRTEKVQDTYWLMETLLNNMEKEFKKKF